MTAALWSGRLPRRGDATSGWSGLRPAAGLAAAVLLCAGPWAAPLRACVEPQGSLAGDHAAAPAPQTGGAPRPSVAPAGRAGRTAAFELLDNPRFEERSQASVAGPRPVPWWRTPQGEQQLGVAPQAGLRTRGEQEWAEQPLAAWAPAVADLRLSGRLRGEGTLVVIDGAGGRAVFAVGESTGGKAGGTAFEFDGAAIAERLGRTPVPRLLIRLEARGAGEALWQEVRASVQLPAPGPEGLRQEVLAELGRILGEWSAAALDDLGPRRSALLCKDFDALTGTTLGVFPCGFQAFYSSLLEAVLAEPRADWIRWLDAASADLLELCIEPATGLPRLWDPRADQPLSEQPVEIALFMGFLIDLAQRGPEHLRAGARAAALRMGEAVLAYGQLPDGNVAASYRPRDGRPNPDVSQLRRLDVPMQLARLSALTGEARFLVAAHEALATLEFTHHWSGTWQAIDPGFDDDFGHYGARAASATLALPGERLFRRFALEGWRHYAPLWRDALRLGGNLAADQVRCWSLLLDLEQAVGDQEPDLAGELAELLRAAARAHFKGEQYGDGSWGDVTIFDFDPRTALQVGDLPGAPQNLLQGLAAAYGSPLTAAHSEELLAMYATVLRSSVETYRRPHGFLLDRRERAGPNSARGSLRMVLGLERMLVRLSR